MRARLFAALSTLALLFLVSEAMTQRPGGGGGGPFGGGGSGRTMDPNALFDRLARDRDFFYASDSQYSRDTLLQWLQGKGLPPDTRITREMYTDYFQWRQANGGFGRPGGGGPPSPGGGGPPGGFPGGGGGGGRGNN